MDDDGWINWIIWNMRRGLCSRANTPLRISGRSSKKGVGPDKMGQMRFGTLFAIGLHLHSFLRWRLGLMGSRLRLLVELPPICK